MRAEPKQKRSYRNVLTARGVLTLLAGIVLAPTPAKALAFYTEFGGGVASAKQGNPSLTQEPGKFSGGYSGQFTLGFHLQDRQNGLLFQLGVQQRLLRGLTPSGQSVQALPLYPILRAEFWRLAIGVGYTPLVWKNTERDRASGARALLYEATFLMPITPEIDFALQGAMQTFSVAGGVKGPNPTVEGLAGFRLNFGLSTTAKSARQRYRGWRYPFGNPNH